MVLNACKIIHLMAICSSCKFCKRDSEQTASEEIVEQYFFTDGK